jgi:methyl coenzyme M reductase gamma subunit
VLALAGMANAPATPSSRAEMAMTRFKGVTSV